MPVLTELGLSGSVILLRFHPVRTRDRPRADRISPGARAVPARSTSATTATHASSRSIRTPHSLLRLLLYRGKRTVSRPLSKRAYHSTKGSSTGWHRLLAAEVAFFVSRVKLSIYACPDCSCRWPPVHKRRCLCRCVIPSSDGFVYGGPAGGHL